MIKIKNVDHVGIRVADEERALKFYEVLGFKFFWRATGDAVVKIKNDVDVEINLVVNGNDDQGGKNILMDVPEKIPFFHHAMACGAQSLVRLRSSSPSCSPTIWKNPSAKPSCYLMTES